MAQPLRARSRVATESRSRLPIRFRRSRCRSSAASEVDSGSHRVIRRSSTHFETTSPARRTVRSRRGDRGTVLMLMPAAVFVLLILGGIAFDYAHLFLAKRELSSTVEAAVQNAVTDGVDQAAVRR